MPAHRHDFDRNWRRAGLRRAFGLEQSRRERRGIERHLQPRPQIDQRAHMVLVTVGQDEANDVFALLDQIADVRQDEIDAGQMLLGRKRHTAIDDEPLSAPLVAKAVNREVHPDLAEAAQRREDKFVVRHHSARVGTRRPARQSKGKTSPAEIFSVPPLRSSKISRPDRSRPTKRPCFSPEPLRTVISSPTPRAAASQSARMTEKFRPLPHWAMRPHMVAERRWKSRAGVIAAPWAPRSVAG